MARKTNYGLNFVIIGIIISVILYFINGIIFTAFNQIGFLIVSRTGLWETLFFSSNILMIDVLSVVFSIPIYYIVGLIYGALFGK